MTDSSPTMSILLENGTPRNPDAFLEGTYSKASDFVFKNGLFFAIFEGNLHIRENANELHRHLSGKSSFLDTGITTFKADFYSAQLLHYGLKPLKTMGPAKKRLLEALEGSLAGGKPLKVPKSILDLELAMQSSWWKELDAGRMTFDRENETEVLNQSHDSVPAPIPQPSSSGDRTSAKRKRKRPRKTKQTAAKRTKLSASSSQEPLSDMETRETAVEGHTTLQAYSPSESAPSRTRPRAKQTARKSTGKPVYHRKSRESVTSRESSSPECETEQTSSEGGGQSESVRPREKVKEYRKTQIMVPMTGAEMRKAIKSLKADQARRALTELVDRSLSQNVLSKVISLAMSNSKPVDLSQMTGLYDIEARNIENDKYGAHFTFEVYPSSTSSHLWASFHFGVISGVMRSVYPAPTSFDTEVYFEWRGYDNGDGMMLFDLDNRAIITFLPGGLLRGKMATGDDDTFSIYGSLESVERKSEAGQHRKVRKWKDEWRGLNAHNYNIEFFRKVMGQRGESPRDEEAFESDTTVGNRKRARKINIENFMASPDWNSFSDEHDEDDMEDEDW